MGLRGWQRGVQGGGVYCFLSFLAEPCSSAGPAAPHLEDRLDPHSGEVTLAH